MFLVERLIVEIDAIASCDSIKNDRNETPLCEHVYRLSNELAVAAFGPRSEAWEAQMLARWWEPTSRMSTSTASCSGRPSSSTGDR